MSNRDGPANIPAWKFVAGVMLHIGVPGYLMTLAATAVWHVAGKGVDGLSLTVGRAACVFVGAYVVITVVITGNAALWDQTPRV